MKFEEGMTVKFEDCGKFWRDSRTYIRTGKIFKVYSDKEVCIEWIMPRAKREAVSNVRTEDILEIWTPSGWSKIKESGK